MLTKVEPWEINLISDDVFKGPVDLLGALKHDKNFRKLVESYIGPLRDNNLNNKFELLEIGAKYCNASNKTVDELNLDIQVIKAKVLKRSQDVHQAIQFNNQEQERKKLQEIQDKSEQDYRNIISWYQDNLPKILITKYFDKESLDKLNPKDLSSKLELLEKIKKIAELDAPKIRDPTLKNLLQKKYDKNITSVQVAIIMKLEGLTAEALIKKLQQPALSKPINKIDGCVASPYPLRGI